MPKYELFISAQAAAHSEIKFNGFANSLRSQAAPNMLEQKYSSACAAWQRLTMLLRFTYWQPTPAECLFLESNLFTK